MKKAFVGVGHWMVVALVLAGAAGLPSAARAADVGGVGLRWSNSASEALTPEENVEPGLEVGFDRGRGPGRGPAAPSNLTATAESAVEIHLRWRDNSTGETGFQVEGRLLGGSFVDLGTTDPDETMTLIWGLAPNTTYEFRVRARGRSGNSGYSNIARVRTDSGFTPSVCREDNTTLCLNGGRFEAIMYFDTPQDPFSRSRAVDLDSDFAGLFYFRNPDNAEVLIKVLDGCGQNNRYWVFYAATTNVEFLIRVTDTDTGQILYYANPRRNPAPPVQDNQAFATCP